jgi:hypothetical protein
MSGAAWSRLAYEIWEKILDDVDTVGLESAQRTCTEWRGIVLAYAASGRLKNRARVSALLFTHDVSFCWIFPCSVLAEMPPLDNSLRWR